jgi:hypothetical protein
MERLPALSSEERIEALRHIGATPRPYDPYYRLALVVEHLPPIKESILRHPEIEKFPVINQKAIFVRNSYHDLYSIIAGLPVKADIRILLTGTPGIGKSTFLLYFIIQFLHIANHNRSASRTRDVLIFQPAESQNEFYAFASPNIVRKGGYSDFEDFLLLPTTWYVVDWKPKSKPVKKPATTLFALSPNSIRDDDFKDFEKTLLMRLCMPVWTYDELEGCRRHIFPELSNSSLRYIYDLVGGVPRSCLEAPTEVLRVGHGEEKAHEGALQRIHAAFSEIKDPLDFIRTQEQSLSAKLSGRLLHKVPASEFRDGWHRVWASAYVIDRFVNMIDAHAANDMHRQVVEGLARNERDGSLGKVFECYVRHLFFKGGGVRLRKRRLFGASDQKGEPELRQWFTVPRNLEHKPFSGMANFSIPKNDTGTIWTPGPNFPSVDMILTPSSLFQITISPHHPVKQEPLRKILEKLPAKENIVLYFVVPEENFETFPFQNYHNTEGKVSSKKPKSVKTFQQWVLGVPLKSFSNKEKAEQSEVRDMPRRKKRKMA